MPIAWMLEEKGFQLFDVPHWRSEGPAERHFRKHSLRGVNSRLGVTPGMTGMQKRPVNGIQPGSEQAQGGVEMMPVKEERLAKMLAKPAFLTKTNPQIPGLIISPVFRIITAHVVEGLLTD